MNSIGETVTETKFSYPSSWNLTKWDILLLKKTSGMIMNMAID